MTAYFEGKDEGRAIIAPATKGPFVVKQSGVDELSKGTNLRQTQLPLRWRGRAGTRPLLAGKIGEYQRLRGLVRDLEGRGAGRCPTT